MNNQLFEQNYFHSDNFKDILRNKDIILKNDIFNDEILLEEIKLKFLKVYSNQKI